MADEHDVAEVADRVDDLLRVIVDADARIAHFEVGRAHLVSGLAQQRRYSVPVPGAAA